MKKRCPKCGGKGYYAYDHNHSIRCEACCKHDGGFWLLEEHYGDDNGKLCCKKGCGFTKEYTPNMGKYMSVILKKMFAMVEAEDDFYNEGFFKTNWYMKHSWTQKNQDRFKKWLVAYLKKNKEARKELCRNTRPTAGVLEKVADEFLLSWGWRVIN